MNDKSVSKGDFSYLSETSLALIYHDKHQRGKQLTMFLIRSGGGRIVKADMKSYIPLETAAIFFLANLFPKQGIGSEYVTADFICMGLLGLQGAKTEN